MAAAPSPSTLQSEPHKPAILVTGFSLQTDDEFLELYFERYGDVERVYMAEEGSAYIEFTRSLGKVVDSTCNAALVYFYI